MADTTLSKEPLLEVQQVRKSFPGVQVLKNISFKLYPGEVLAVVGENGAGKSTLMNIIGGLFHPDEGEILLEGKSIGEHSVAHAQELGIVLIHQELTLAENLDVEANIFLGREQTYGGPLKLLSKKTVSITENILKRVGLNCSPKTIVSKLSAGQKQLVEIAKAMSLQSKVLILDEPTASLTPKETAYLFEIMSDLKKQGVGILYISHRLKDVEEVADSLIALRDGEFSGELKKTEINHNSMVKLMVGRELKQFFQHTHIAPKEGGFLLEVKDLILLENQSRPINFSLRAGEIVGLSGLMGSGRSELAQALFGIRQHLSGKILLQDKSIDIRNPEDAIKHGIVLVPEDRHAEGLVLNEKIKENISLPSLKRLSWNNILLANKEKSLAEDMCKTLNVRTPNINKIVGQLSGGNQQKIVFAKWLTPKPKILILDEPTRGVDIVAKEEIYKIMDQLAADGVAILMISSDLEEILGMSDRVLVMHNNYIAGELTENITEESIMSLSTGGENN